MKTRAAEINELRLRRVRMLTGADVDHSDHEVKAALTQIERTAQRYQRALLSRPKLGVLWSDLARHTPSSNAISSQYLRLSAMALAWATPGQRLYRRPALLRHVIGALEWLDEHEFNAHVVESGNWYDFEIGAPRCLVDTLVLLDDEVPRSRRRRLLSPVRTFDSNPDVIDVETDQAQAATGSNRTDKAMVELYAGILLEDARAITTAAAALQSVFRPVTEGDGFYADGSFVFHGFFPYTGNYGQLFLADVADAFHLLSDTCWDLGARRRATAARWARESFAPLIYRGGMMDMVRGRLISYSSSPSHAVGHRAITAMLRLSQTISDKDATLLRAQIKRWWAEDTSRSFTDGLSLDLIGEAKRIREDRAIAAAAPPSQSKVFASMDRVVHLRPRFGVGIAMHSTRIQNYECINGNNLEGWHTGDGMLYLHDSDLLQFDDDFWPTVDPQRLPGTTVIAGAKPPGGTFGRSAAVGGTSLEQYSAVMMQLNVLQGRLQAKKSWFLLDDEVVALGADIRCTVAGKRVATIVDNRKLKSSRTPALVRRRGAHWATLPASATTPPIGYLFPDGTAFRSRRAARTGSWNDIDAAAPNKPLTATYQTIQIDHGVMPRHARYAYVLLPGRDAADTEAYALRPAVRVLANSARGQAILHKALGITAANIWVPGATVAGITADAPCAVIVRRVSDRLLIAVSDPTQVRARTIHLTIDGPVGKPLALDRGITVTRRSPRAAFSIRTTGSAGRPFHASFAAADRKSTG